MPHTPAPPPAGSSVVPLLVTPDDAPTVIRPAPPALPAPAPGDRVGPYEVVGVAGTGGMARVLRARDPDLGREVALKMLPPEAAADPEVVARFKLEARAAAQLDHDAVARVFACGEDGGRPYIAFEFVEGETLRDVIAARGPLPAAECAVLVAQVAAGLAHAADRGVVHRDVKPSNLIVTPAGRVKIVDMGLARSDAVPADGGVTKSGVTLGTFDYISPEQALDPRRADARSDIYSLGCTVYHAATGRPPVPPGTAAAKLRAHQADPVVDPRVYNPAVPLGLARLLATMMAKNPAKRFQTPRELLAAAAALAAELGAAADALPPDARAVAAPVPPATAGRGGLAAGLAAAGVAVVVAAGLLAPGRPGPTAPPWEPAGRPGAVEPPPLPGGQQPKPAAPGPTVTAATTDELVAALKESAVTTVRLTGPQYDLTGQPAGVAVGGRASFTLLAAAGRPVLRVAAAAPAEADRWHLARPGSLTVAGVPAVTLRGLRVEVAAGPPADGERPADRPAGLAVADADSVTVENCWFEPAAGDEPPDAAALLVARAADATPTGLSVRDGLFQRRLGGGLALAGPVRAAVSDCLFAPLPAAVRLDGAGGGLTLDRCKFLLEHGAAVDLGAGADWPVEAGGSVFATGPADPAAAAMAMMGDGPPRPAVVRTADGPDRVRFAGRPGEPNVYHGADAVAAPGQVLTLAAARRPGGPVRDPAGDDRRTSPWGSGDPAAELDRPDPRRAFRTDPPPAPADPAPAAAVWWPAAPAADPARLTYPTLAAAVRAVPPGGELHVRHTGELPLPAPVVWARPGRLTVRPAPGAAPVLVPPARDPTAVRLLAGEVRLDGLAVRLPRAGAAVTVAGGTRAELAGCTVTLDGPGAAAVRLLGRQTEAAVRLADTLVRGRGAVLAAGDRPAGLDLSNCWVAVAGPLATAGGGPLAVALTRVTAVTTGPLIDGPTGVVRVTAERCLFAPLGGRLTPAAGVSGWEFRGPNWVADPAFSPPPGADGVVARRVTFARPPQADALAAVEPADLTVLAPDPPAGGVGAGRR